MSQNQRPSGLPTTSANTSPPSTRRNSLTNNQEHVPPPSQFEVPRPSATIRRRPTALKPTRTGSNFVSGYAVPTLGRQDPQSPRKPGIGRRTSSRLMPHRGESFSVDDASQEIEEEEVQQRQAKSPDPRVTGAMRRTPSTLRRKTTAPSQLFLAQTLEAEEDDDDDQPFGVTSQVLEDQHPSFEDEGTTHVEEEEEHLVGGDEDLSEAESFTLKDRQQAINETHPFGIRIWKPALYKKHRSVVQGAEGDIRSTPGGQVSRWLWFFNFAWTICFGWWLSLFAALGALVCYMLVFAPGCRDYGSVLLGLAGYVFYPFGKYMKLVQDEAYAEEDEGEGRSISEYEQWQSGALEEGRLFFGPAPLVGRRRSSLGPHDADEATSLLGRSTATRRRAQRMSISGERPKRRLFGRGHWNVGRVIFFLVFWAVLTPLFLFVASICWMLIFTLPMARVMAILWDQLRRRPLTIEFHSDSTYTRGPESTPSTILLCTYRATGWRYWKYTIDGTNIILFNLLSIVAFVIFDYFVLRESLGLKIALTNSFFIFLLSLFSVIPLAYFIGQAVASISAQSTMGVGAAVNAFFSTIVEVFLYCVALREGKAQLVEGSLIGSIFAGILLLPGISMCFGAIKRKTQRFNVKSAGITTTMLLFATIGAFSPTLFYQIYGAHELTCYQCVGHHKEPAGDRDCKRCFFTQIPAVNEAFYNDAVRPYTWIAAAALFLAYVIGLLFTLRTHAATIWNTDLDEKKETKIDQLAHKIAGHANATGSKIGSVDYGGLTVTTHPLSRVNTTGSISRVDIKDSQLYKRILGQSLKQAGLTTPNDTINLKKDDVGTNDITSSPVLQPLPENGDSPNSPHRRLPSIQVMGLSAEESQSIVRTMAEMAATAATVAARDATSAPRRTSAMSRTGSTTGSVRGNTVNHNPNANHTTTTNNNNTNNQAELADLAALDPAVAAAHGTTPSGGHDAPNWSRSKSYFVLLTATIAYAIIAEILVSTVDSVLAHSDIDEKFLGITLFALVPNTTEFLNAISFAMNGNIALSMEIGSAYALQVCLLQIPALVLFSALDGWWEPQFDPVKIIDHTFTLIFPQWDMVTVILCVFLLSYMYGEGKSNYFKGSILILSYLVVIVGFYVAGSAGLGLGSKDGPGYTEPPTGVVWSQRVKGGRLPKEWVEWY